jgi:hypothetical protein
MITKSARSNCAIAGSWSIVVDRPDYPDPANRPPALGAIEVDEPDHLERAARFPTRLADQQLRTPSSPDYERPSATRGMERCLDLPPRPQQPWNPSARENGSGPVQQDHGAWHARVETGDRQGQHEGDRAQGRRLREREQVLQTEVMPVDAEDAGGGVDGEADGDQERQRHPEDIDVARWRIEVEPELVGKPVADDHQHEMHQGMVPRHQQGTEPRGHTA